MSYMTDLAENVKLAQDDIANATTVKKNEALNAIANALVLNAQQIITANEKDLENAKSNGISDVMLDRLKLDETRIKSAASGVLKVMALNDPIGEILSGKTLSNGLQIKKVRVALGIIGVIYESRPNVTIDVVALCLKSSNAVILRGGKEAINTNIAIMNIMQNAIKSVGLNENIIALVKDTSREVSTEMMKLNDYLDVLIPRGGAGLIQSVLKNATVPVIETGVGNCHIYVDSFADFEMAKNIVFNAKTSRPSVCNACENMLVHKEIAKEFLPIIKAKLDEKNVVIYGCEKTKEILGNDVILATDEDFATEFLDYKISVKVVDDINEAISHIKKFTTHHSEAIVTDNFKNANIFTTKVDAAAVYVNASTRFTDGEVFGLGGEIGISTQKLHARGPMGLCELTSSKYIVFGTSETGNIR
ncbi:MAG: glutamate-5-semialdehyde dehydrogenase [Oscillospiraceae bacterium]